MPAPPRAQPFRAPILADRSGGVVSAGVWFASKRGSVVHATRPGRGLIGERWTGESGFMAACTRLLNPSHSSVVEPADDQRPVCPDCLRALRRHRDYLNETIATGEASG